MVTVSFAKMIQELQSDRIETLPAFDISILRNVTVEAMEPYLRYDGLTDSYNFRCRFGEFDNVYQEAVGGNEYLFHKDVECIVVLLQLDTLSVDLSRRFPGLSGEQIQHEKDRISALFEDVLAGVRRQTNALVVWAGLELPVWPALGVLGDQAGCTQYAVINELNTFLQNRLAATESAFFLDLNRLLARHGVYEFYDLRYWHIGKAPWSRPALQSMARELIRFIRPVLGTVKKCLVLDCDNTLWGGLIGEDGLEGIALATTYPGSAWSEFQQEIVNLYYRGVLIALCSKNNEEDVWEVFKRHPDMVLRREHIVAYRINWNDKAGNLREIATELNIGLDSLVVVDDSDFEINLIRETLPEVRTLHADTANAVGLRTMLSSCGYFDTLSLSDEDRKRSEMYRAETSRKKHRSANVGLDSYLASLEMAITISLVGGFSVPRVAQLTQKTNQFNLTTRRYTENGIKALGDDKNADVVQIELRDRFGEMGIVGVCIVRYDSDSAILDSFLLSCRALGRGVEQAFLRHVARRVSSRGVKSLNAEYIPTRKNEQTREFYPSQGFDRTGQSGETVFYGIKPDAIPTDKKEHFASITCEFDGQG